MRILTIPLLTISMSVIPAQSPDKKLIKTFDKVKRMEYYKSCKLEKQKDCHLKSFNKSIVYKFVGE